MRPRHRRKPPSQWTASHLQRLDDRRLLEVGATAITDRSILQVGPLKIENKLKRPAPPESIALVLEETGRRGLTDILVQRVVQDAAAGRSFLGQLLAPTDWKRYEQQAALALIAVVKDAGVAFEYEFDARLTGQITGDERQVDLLFKKQDGDRLACEIRKHSDAIPVKDVEAFASKLLDLGVKKGAIISPVGFQSGAIKTAKHHSIDMFRFHEVTGEQAQRLELEKPVEASGTYWHLQLHGGQGWLFSATTPPAGVSPSAGGKGAPPGGA